MAELRLRRLAVGSAGYAPPVIPREPQAGDLREDAGGSAPAGWRSDLQGKVPDAKKPEAGRRGGWEHQEACLRFYQLKTGHCVTGQSLNWTKKRPTPQCWWCYYQTQTRDHLFKECPEWKPQQKILWAEVKKETGRWKDRWKIRDLLADERCSRAVLDFLTSTDVGRRVRCKEEDAVSAVSEL